MEERMEIPIKKMGMYHISKGFLDDIDVKEGQPRFCERCFYNGMYLMVKPRIVKGGSDKKLLIISDYPGYHEGKTGIAYSGRTGKFVLDLFSDSDFSIIIMNAVNHYNPNIPSEKEVEACQSYVRSRLLYYFPSMIWLAGKLPLNSFNIDIKPEYIYNYMLTGEIEYYENIFPFVATVNPALVLRLDSSKLYNIVVSASQFIKRELAEWKEDDENG